MINVVKLIKNLFKIAKLISVDDSGDFQFATVSTLGKEQKVLMLKLYGLMSNPPTSSMVALWNQQGQESNGIGIADDPKNRIFKDMAEGEVALGNYVAGGYIYFDENGNANIYAPNDATITALNAITQAAPTITQAATTSITQTAPTIEQTATTEITQAAPAIEQTGTTIAQNASTSIAQIAPAVTQSAINLTHTATTAITQTAPTIAMNGTSDNLVTWTDLNAALQTQNALIAGHSHAGAGLIDTTITINIIAARANSLTTDG